MARKNPTTDFTTPDNGFIEGMDQLPIAAGSIMKVKKDGNAMPEVNMSPNNGDNKGVPDAPFANGKDIRHFEGSPRSNPTPEMPGA